MMKFSRDCLRRVLLTPHITVYRGDVKVKPKPIRTLSQSSRILAKDVILQHLPDPATTKTTWVDQKPSALKLQVKGASWNPAW